MNFNEVCDKIQSAVVKHPFTTAAFILLALTVVFLPTDLIVFSQNNFVKEMPYWIIVAVELILFGVIGYFESKTQGNGVPPNY